MADAVNVAQAAPDAISLIGTAVTSGGGAAALGWLLLRSKLESISKLWGKLDAVKEELISQREAILAKIADQRLSDAKEYATRDEMIMRFDKLEQHIDKRIDALEEKITDALRRGV